MASARVATTQASERKKAVTKALRGEAKWKYFKHAGGLLTADGSDDHLIKLEGVPPVYKLPLPP